MGQSTRIALDTNILLAIEEFKVDVFTQLRGLFGKVDVIVPEQVIEELLRFRESNKKIGKSARVALEIISKKNVKKVEVKGKNADDALVALSGKAIIASLDKGLLKKLKEKNVMTLSLRQKKFIVPS